MAIRYKTTTLAGKPILSHRKVWIQHHGEIPDGYHVHHKNGDRFDNRIENLELMTPAEHCAHHGMGRPAWNKGMRYGQTEAYEKSNRARNENYARVCQDVYREWSAGSRQVELAEKYGVSRRQICDRLRAHRLAHNLPNGRGHCAEAGSRAVESRDGVSQAE